MDQCFDKRRRRKFGQDDDEVLGRGIFCDNLPPSEATYTLLLLYELSTKSLTHLSNLLSRFNMCS